MNADEHLRAADPTLAALMDRIGVLPPRLGDSPAERADHYGALIRIILAQQISTHAARAIYRRLLDRYGGRPPTPRQLLAADLDELRSAIGLSRPKMRYLHSLAELVERGELDLDGVATLPDEDAIAELVQVKGLGVWSAQVLLMGHFDRPDVLPTGDIGIQEAIRRAYGLGVKPVPDEMERIAAPWRPFRTRACRWLWRSLANEPA